MLDQQVSCPATGNLELDWVSLIDQKNSVWRIALLANKTPVRQLDCKTGR